MDAPPPAGSPATAPPSAAPVVLAPAPTPAPPSPPGGQTYYPYSYISPTGQPTYGGPISSAGLPPVIESDGQPTPPGYRLERRPRSGLVLAGVGVWAPFYAFAVTAAIAGHSSKDRVLFLPVLGPAIDLIARRNCSTSDGYDNRCEGPTALLQFDLLGQLAGATMFVIGLAAQREVFVRTAADKRPSFVVVPQLGTGESGRAAAPGLTALGQF